MTPTKITKEKKMIQTKILNDFPNYVIYSDGRIWSNTSNLFMKFSATKDGYLGTVLTDKDGKRVAIKIHRLVAMAFLPNPNNYPHVNHIDENKNNNDVNNLEWCSPQYNELFGSHQKVLLNPPQSIKMLDPNTNEVIKIFETMGEADRFLQKTSAHSNIIKCLRGERKTAYGYKWEKN